MLFRSNEEVTTCCRTIGEIEGHLGISTVCCRGMGVRRQALPEVRNPFGKVVYEDVEELRSVEPDAAVCQASTSAVRTSVSWGDGVLTWDLE